MRTLALLLTVVMGQVLFAAPESNVQADPARFTGEIAEFQQWDGKNSFPADAVLFVGSSSIRMWPTHVSFPDLPLINRGFGGSQISDINFYFTRVVLPYKPKVIVFYAGDNDIVSDKNAEQVLADYKQFVKMVQAEMPKTSVIFISIKPSGSRWNFWPEMQRANELIKDYCKKDNRLIFVEAGAVLLNKDGKPNDEYFLEDKLHLNEQGYRMWTQILRPVIERELAHKGD